MKTPHKIRLVIGEQMTLNRHALVSLLSQRDEFSILAETDNDTHLLKFLEEQEVDVALIVTSMPGMEECDMVKKVVAMKKPPAIILLSRTVSDHVEQFAIANQISYLYEKNCTPSLLFEAIRLAAGRLPELQQMSPQIIAEEPSNELNEKETEILRQICEGKTNREIAAFLNLALGTVDFYRTKIYRKTKSSNIAGVFRYALQKKLICVT